MIYISSLNLRIKKDSDEYFNLIRELRLIKVKQLFDSFYARIDKIKDYVLLKSLLGTAANYVLNHRGLAYNYFLDGRLTLSNNAAKIGGVKTLVIGKKNWLFACTEKCAEVTCAMYSLVKTALTNGLDLNSRSCLKQLFNDLLYSKRKDFN